MTSAASELHTRRLKLVFMGTPPFAALCLERLLSTRHSIAAVVTRADKPRGRGMELQPSAVKQLAAARGLEVLTPVSARDPALLERFRRIAPDLGVVVAYGRILPIHLFETPRLGCINAHASLLPALRGAAPIERAIMEGFAETGITIMRISERLDAGDMMISRAVPIGAATNAGELRETLAAAAADLLVAALDALAAGTARFVPQDETKATYAPPLTRDEGRIDWREPATRTHNRVRAFAPHPAAFTSAGTRRLKVLRGAALDEAGAARPGTILGTRGEGITIACGLGVYLLELVQPEGKRPMSAAAWLRGSGVVAELGEHA